jgi:hypothetical protein
MRMLVASGTSEQYNYFASVRLCFTTVDRNFAYRLYTKTKFKAQSPP